MDNFPHNWEPFSRGDAMQKKNIWGLLAAGAAAGLVNGLFAAGGGMLLVPLLTGLTQIPEEEVFPTSVSIILPICLVSLALRLSTVTEALPLALPYLLGGVAGGILAVKLGKKIPVKWLHRGLGLLILWGGVRYLC